MRTRQTVNVLAGALALHLLYRLAGSHTTTSVVVDTGSAQVVYDEHPAGYIPHKLLHPLEKPQQVALEHDPDSEVEYDPAPELSKSSKGKSKATEDEDLDPVTISFGHIDVDLAHAPILPSTELLSHADGWTVMRDVYMSNGTFYLIVNSTARKDWPDFRYITSTGLPGFNTPENIAAREPTAQEIAFITHDEAMARWGPSKIFSRNAVTTVHGNTILYNDPPQFLDHYYHFVAELLFGTWAAWRGTFARALSVLDSANRPSGADTLISSDADPRALPHRVIFAHSPGGSAKLAGDQKSSLRDKFGLNTLFLRSAFPSVDLEDEQSWMERSAQTSHGNSAWHFPNLMLVDRSASFRGPITGECHRTAAAAYYPHTRSGALKADWWEPVRSAILNHITPALPDDEKQTPFPEPHFGFPGPKGWTTPSRIPLVRDDMRLQAGIEGGARRMRAENKFDASAWETSEKAEHALRVKASGLESQAGHAATAKADDDKVVVTYISRQKSRRRLTESDHDALVLALQEMSERRGFELNIVLAEKLTASAQLALAARTTILLGVHGNGLTHLLMMPPRARSTVIEIFYPEGFAHDYEWTTRSLGMKHFGVWNDTSITWPELPWVAYPNGFQGMDIPVHPPNIIKIIEGRVDGTL